VAHLRVTCGDHLDLRTNARRGDHRQNGRGFWAVAAAFATIQFGGAIPIPLYGLWRGRFSFGNGTLTAISKFASLTATAMNTGGLGAGTLFAGVIAAYAHDPVRLVFWIYLATVAAALLGVSTVAETVRRQERVSWRPRGLGLPGARRGTFWLAGAAAFAVFSQLGLYSSLVPSFLAGSLHEHNLAVAGTVSAAIFLVATATQLSFHRVTPGRAINAGLALLLAGLALIELGLWTGDLGVLLVGTLGGGLAVGFAFMGAAATVDLLASPERRGQVLATFFCCAYAGLSCPALAVGIATDSVSVTSATLACAVAIGVISIATMIPFLTGRARADTAA